ncbi:MAG: hypothetical protein ABIH27_01330 [Candidatus Omnitrophota bacterium]
MDEVITFNHIPIPLPKERIYKRLGYRDNITKVSLKQKKEVEGYIKDALKLIRLKAAARFMKIKKITPPEITIFANTKFSSDHLCGLLAGCQEVLFMAATAGNKIIKAIQKDSQGENVMRSVVLDAAASEMTDSILDWLMGHFNKKLARQNKTLTRRRFSAGYGDFLLKNQKSIFKLLKLKKIGININKNYILIPEKSVTAVAGVKIR